VLVGDSGGAPETVLPGETGFIVRDADDIAEGIAMLLDAPERRLAMGRAGRERVANEFTWPKVADRLIRGFEEVL
jgi:phosphatidyl-myo-inositol dimannoside synthase